MVDAFLNPLSLPDRTERVSLIQTHISLVFVADDFVYKVKKPVNFGFLDFSTLEKRKYYCHQEVMLNNRLSKGIYLDVLPITWDGGKFVLGGHGGQVVEYAVKMRRIPDDILMKTLFEAGRLSEDRLEEIARLLADFHLRAERSSEIDHFGMPDIFKVNTDENFDQVEKYIGMTIQGNDFQALKEWTNRFYHSYRDFFLKRVAEGKIKDCHGDLHMEHICFTDRISAIDCIEFNERFRYGDSLADMAFLLMDLDFHGGRNLSSILWDMYRDKSFEGKEVEPLLLFYKVYRAFVRGKVISFQLDDEGISNEKKRKALRSAISYFHLARNYIE